MSISVATCDDIPILCELLDALFSQEFEFHPDHQLQAEGLRLSADNPVDRPRQYRSPAFLRPA